MARIDPRRYRKVRRFVTRTFLHLLWWDLVLSRTFLRRFSRPALERWTEIARRYRVLAVEMGGVLIKLGQFLSVRVDLLPPEITGELAGLQDEVPPGRFEEIVRQIEADFGRPLEEVFARFDPDPIGAASLAQVHRAALPGGEEVVVKVLRPGIDVLVETDLAAVGLALRLLRVSKRLRRRIDLGRLADEFNTVTRRELDMLQEGQSAERFAHDFAGDRRVYVPKVFWPESAPRTLTLEDVGYLKTTDLPALERAGIGRRDLARALYTIYMQQIFVHHFVHADPHPGNLFVRPLPGPGEAPFRPGDPVPPLPPDPANPANPARREFQVVFVDFGMVAVIPERLRAALREIAIALGTRDAPRLVRAYADAGIILPGADLRRLEEVHRTLFDRFWGVSIGRLRETALSQVPSLLLEYRDLLYSLPFQMPVDLLFSTRSLGLLAGMATSLDPDFDLWTETVPVAERLARAGMGGWREWLDEAAAQGRVVLTLPRRIDEVLSLAERGGLAVQAALPPETRRALQRVERATLRLAWMVVASALLLAAVALHIAGEPAGRWLGGLAAAAFLWGVVTKR
jgi:predicted unusual protein kinase regulating ubiquinone biosynthesis (AarF/ABC1/UbiB family)